MEQETHTVVDSSSSESPVWPGSQLREAREALNLTHQDVARKLRLDAGLIRAMEDNNRDALPAQTYLVGYLRSYARLLNLPAESIIAAIPLKSQPTSSLLPDNIDYRPRHRIAARLLRLLLLGIVVVLLLAAGWWVFSLGPEWLSHWLNLVNGSKFSSFLYPPSA
jgi:cytoskeleton protein RodZ